MELVFNGMKSWGGDLRGEDMGATLPIDNPVKEGARCEIKQ